MAWNAVSVQEGVKNHFTIKTIAVQIKELGKKVEEERKRKRDRQHEQKLADHLDKLMRDTGKSMMIIAMSSTLRHRVHPHTQLVVIAAFQTNTINLVLRENHKLTDRRGDKEGKDRIGITLKVSVDAQMPRDVPGGDTVQS